MISLIYGVLAALLFGMSPPLCKLLLDGASPLALAALLYLGAGCGLLCGYVLRRALLPFPGSLPPKGRDWFLMAGATVSGSVLAPGLLLVGLERTPASEASLLLNLELVATALMAWLFFREGFDRRVGWGLALILAGCLTLSWPSQVGWGGLAGPAAVAAACVLWGLDNNLTQRLAERDPLVVAGLKGTAGGAVNGLLAWVVGQEFPTGAASGAALLVGFFGYGLSLVFFVLSLRRVGTARTAALFALAPFIGAGLSFLILGEPLTLLFGVGLILVAAGLMVALGFRHQHPHAHAQMEHEHLHDHDEHHDHRHEIGGVRNGSHTHVHFHDALLHVHPHYPDSHHRHEHPS